MTNVKIAGAIALIVGIILLIVFFPFAILWSLNTLFPVLAIPYNFWTWLAVVALNLSWMSKSVSVRKG